MASDIAVFLSSAARLSVSAAAAQVVRFGADGAQHEASSHYLQADDWLHWDYSIRDERGEARHTCDGTAIRSTLPGRSETRHSPVPDPPSRDDPLHFCSWIAFTQGWFVEMLRPIDLLARVLVTSIRPPDGEGRVRISAEPMGNEPSPYSGFGLPDGRRLDLLLDTRLGCFTEVTVAHQGPAANEGTLSHRLTRLEP
ncbi:hypothetical protein ACFQZ2_06120 [Streptomonospora algeriensis]|uniref:Uncharacterized protein n=1 Tax=Streptomonospora algeriensis TaxID=995084 RepID=A0ABW3BC16_9ACTN